MADITINDLPADATPTSDDIMHTQDTGTGADQKVTLANLATALATIGSYATADSTTTFTNKTIDADGTGNSITNIEDANIKAAAAIDATKLADGSVTNTELQYINTLSSNAQTQINGKLGLAGGTMTGDVNLDGNDITNFAATSFNVTDDGNSGAADTIDFSATSFHKSTLTGNVTYTLTAPFSGGTDQVRLQMKIVADATAGWDITWPSNVIFPEGEPTWTNMTANQKVYVTLIYDDEDDEYIAQATSFFD